MKSGHLFVQQFREELGLPADSLYVVRSGNRIGHVQTRAILFKYMDIVVGLLACHTTARAALICTCSMLEIYWARNTSEMMVMPGRGARVTRCGARQEFKKGAKGRGARRPHTFLHLAVGHHQGWGKADHAVLHTREA